MTSARRNHSEILAEETKRVEAIIDQITAQDYAGATEAANSVMKDHLSTEQRPWEPGLFPAAKFLSVYAMAKEPLDGYDADNERNKKAQAIVRKELSMFTLQTRSTTESTVTPDLLIALHANLATLIGGEPAFKSPLVFEDLADMIATNQSRDMRLEVSGRDSIYLNRSTFYGICERFLGSGVARTIAEAGFGGIETALSTHRDHFLTPLATSTYMMPSLINFMNDQ